MGREEVINTVSNGFEVACGEGWMTFGMCHESASQCMEYTLNAENE